MNNNPKERRERRAWILLILIVPLGVGCMLVAGQTAIRMLPRWSVNADMGSNLNPNDGSAYNNSVGLVEPIKPNILTPAAWAASFLTPHPGASGGGTVVPFVVFTETATTTATQVSSPTDTATSTGTGTATATPPPPVGTITTVTKTKKPGGGGGTTTSTATASPSPSPTPSPVTSTPEGAQVTIPAGYNEGTPDASYATLNDGDYAVITLSNPVVVTNPSDTAPDMVYYERVNPAVTPTQIAMDSVIVGISQNASGNPYYQVFNWGDGTPDTNTNVDTTTLSPPALPTSPPEADNAVIETASLSGTPPNQTGITIDVDNAPSHPPPGSYQYVVIIAPVSPPNDGNDGAEVDAVQAVP